MKRFYQVYFLVFFNVLTTLNLVQAQELKPDGFLNNGGTTASHAVTLVSSLGEPVVGLLKVSTLHYLQGFVYKAVAYDFSPVRNQPPLVTIYPNPASDYFYIDYPVKDFQKLLYVIYFTDFKLLKRGQLTEPKTRVDVSLLISGTYVLVLMDTKSQIISKNKLLILK
jgi:hypothetical protein